GFGGRDRPLAEDAGERIVQMTQHLVRGHLSPGARTLVVQLLQARDDRVDRAGLAQRVHRRPIATRDFAVRTYMTPFESAGVAITSSPISFTATCRNARPASTTSMLPSSLDRWTRPSAAPGAALKPFPTVASRCR